MDNLSNKALIIAAALLVTIVIVSAVIGIIGRISDVYAKVYNTDVSIQGQFGEFDMYNNAKKKGIDLKNAANKYLDSPSVSIKAYNFGNVKLNTTANISKLKNIADNAKYLTVVTEDKDKNGVTGFITITFNKR